MAKGTATLAFGSTPAVSASKLVNGQTSIGSGSHVEAFVMHGDSTADNDTDAHEMMRAFGFISCKVTVPGDEFEILCNLQDGMLAQGDFSIRWVWN